MRRWRLAANRPARGRHASGNAHQILSSPVSRQRTAARAAPRSSTAPECGDNREFVQHVPVVREPIAPVISPSEDRACSKFATAQGKLTNKWPSARVRHRQVARRGKRLVDAHRQPGWRSASALRTPMMCMIGKILSWLVATLGVGIIGKQPPDVGGAIEEAGGRPRSDHGIELPRLQHRGKCLPRVDLREVYAGRQRQRSALLASGSSSPPPRQ